jgi:HlyD family secretion protein
MKLNSFLQTRVIVAVVAVVLIASVFVACRGRDDTALRYRSEAIDRGDITQTVSANGTLNPVTLVVVGTQVSGTVKKLLADYNDRVEQGQVLVMLDDALLKAQLIQDSANLAAAENALKVARNNLLRVRDLNKEGFVSQQELDAAEQATQDAQARVTQLKASVDKARANIGYSIIRSPVSGVVVSRSVDEGQTVAASFNTPELFKIAKDLREMQIEAYFAEADIGQIKVGQVVKFRVDAFSGQRMSGTVKQIRLNPKTESNVVTYNVVITVANPDETLLPGMTAYVDIGVQSRVNVLRVPNAALRFRPTDESSIEKAEHEKVRGSGGGTVGKAAAKAADASERRGESRRGANNMGRVYLVRDGKLLQRYVKTGITDRRFTELAGDELKEGDMVVVEEVDPTHAGKPAGQQRGMQFGM